MNSMIAVETAKKIVQSLDFKRKKIIVALDEALGCCLSSPIVSNIDMPPFRQSAMDGYALCLHNDKHYTVVGEIQAGDAFHPILKAGEALRIFTGAAVPDTANAVVMQEKTTLEGQQICLEQQPLEGANIRPVAEQNACGSTVMQAGQILNPATIGFLAGLGVQEVEVFKPPKVAIVATGNELIAAGQALQRGQIYESNSLMLKMALQQQGYKDIQTYHLKDNFDQTKKTFRKIIATNDFLIVSGGISVGDYDFVGKALIELKTKTLFYKVRQKPGKPMYLGQKDDCTIFALPGNPAASLSCFYQYVLPAFKNFEGHRHFTLPCLRLALASDYHKKGTRAQFLKAYAKQHEVTILGKQSSAMLDSFVQANAFVYIPESQKFSPAASLVDVFMIPF